MNLLVCMFCNYTTIANISTETTDIWQAFKVNGFWASVINTAGLHVGWLTQSDKYTLLMYFSLCRDIKNVNSEESIL